MANVSKIEYRVIPINRYIVTRYEAHDGDVKGAGCGSEERGTYSSPDTAYEVAYALCKAEHERLGFALDDDRIRYPGHPHHKNAVCTA